MSKGKAKLVKLPEITPVIAQQVWSIKNIQDKKEYILKYMSDKYNTPEQETIRNRIKNAKNPTDVDMLVANMMLKTDGNAVI